MSHSEPCHLYPTTMWRDDHFYYHPIYTTYRNDVPLSPEAGVMEATHTVDLYHDYADKHNDHYSPYSERHPDPLERRIYEPPDVEVYTYGEHEPQWYVGLNLCHALNGAYWHGLQTFGDAVQPEGWDREQPYLNYDFGSQLAKLGMPYIPKPLGFHEGLYHLPFDSLADLQRHVHHNNFYIICLIATARIIDAVKMTDYHNLAYASYMRGSPALVSAHRHWCRTHGYLVLDRSEDDESTADFELSADEQEASMDALAPISPAITRSPAEEEALALQPGEHVFDPTAGMREVFPRNVNRGPFALANMELLRSLRGQWNDFEHASNAATSGSPPIRLSGLPEFDVESLVARLQEASTSRTSPEPTGWGSDVAESEWEWPTNPADPNVPRLGSPSWPTITQQATPPLSWEDYWSTIKGEEASLDEDTEMTSDLVDHIIQTHPATVV
ncbi:unnamed protein product [Rhizoctonia solani]|uniref:Uncharacterized protein n=2 Tax=Rhizoctonia solani TaxID=456999 RepID=A0A8H3AC20_9AGAM